MLCPDTEGNKRKKIGIIFASFRPVVHFPCKAYRVKKSKEFGNPDVTEKWKSLLELVFSCMTSGMKKVCIRIYRV